MTNIDYGKVVIYKIVCKDLNIDMCYVGHTTNFLIRKASHKKIHQTQVHLNLT